MDINHNLTFGKMGPLASFSIESHSRCPAKLPQGCCMKLISVLPGILTIEFCLLNLTHCSCSLRIISLPWQDVVNGTSHHQPNHSLLVYVALFFLGTTWLWSPKTDCHLHLLLTVVLTCMSLHVDQAYHRYSVGICRCTTNIMCSVHSRLHLKV